MTSRQKNTGATRTSFSPLRKIVFGIVFFCLILLGMEFLFSFVNLDQYDHIFMPRSSYPIFVPGKGKYAGLYHSSFHFNEFINWQTFPEKKAPGTYRIFVIGGSAAYAWPYSDKYGFTGYLRRAFDAVLPGKVEIINAAGMSYGSHRVLDVLQDVLLHDPDLVIVLSGNNEYVERNVLPLPPKADTVAEKLNGLLGNTNIYRAVRLALYKVSPGTFSAPRKPDITDIRSNAEFERGALGRTAAIDREVLKNYRSNLTSIKELLVKQKIKGIFCTVPVNIGGWIPTVDDPQFKSEDDARQWMRLYNLKEEAYQKRDAALEAKYLEQMLTITPTDPGMLFNYGKVLWNLGRYDDSYRELVKAKDLDARPIRALSSFNKVIRSLADEKQGIFLADLEEKFKELYFKRVAEKLFIDYCHFTDSGHQTVAFMLLPVIQKAMQRTLPLGDIEKHIMADKTALTRDSNERAAEMYAMALTLQNNRRIAEAIEMYKKILALAPDNKTALSNTSANLGNIYLEQGNLDEAERSYLQSIAFHPENIAAHEALGMIALRKNNLDKAEKNFQAAQSINPYTPAATYGLAEVAMQRNHPEQAVRFYEKTLQLGRDNFELRRELGDAYLKAGDKKNAVLNWQAALKFDPYDKETKTLVERNTK